MLRPWDARGDLQEVVTRGGQLTGTADPFLTSALDQQCRRSHQEAQAAPTREFRSSGGSILVAVADPRVMTRIRAAAVWSLPRREAFCTSAAATDVAISRLTAWPVFAGDVQH